MIDQALSIPNTQSPEVTSKAAQGGERDDDTVKTLSEKLSQALLSIRDKQDLVKQHAKVAEEAVSGWERAENEVSALKKQNESLTHKNTSLEERIIHLDGALKECLRQLRQAVDEQDEKIHDLLAKKCCEWESNQVAGLRSAVEALERQNSALRLKLVSKSKELDLRTHECNLSTLAAETASKQHLDSIKRASPLEAECRLLKATTSNNNNNSNKNNNNRPMTASSIFMESFTDSQLDVLPFENQGFKTDNKGQNYHFSSLVEIGLMDDFLDMERLAAMQEACISVQENDLRGELVAIVRQIFELNENCRKVTAEKVDLEMALDACRVQLNLSQEEFSRVKKELESMKVKVDRSTELSEEANKAKKRLEVELEDAKVKKMEIDSQLEVAEHELESLRSSIFTLEKEIEKEKEFSQETVGRCNILQSEISRVKANSQFQRSAIIEEFRINQDKELAEAASKFAECEKTIASIDCQLKSLATFEDFMIDDAYREQ